SDTRRSVLCGAPRRAGTSVLAVVRPAPSSRTGPATTGAKAEAPPQSSPPRGTRRGRGALRRGEVAHDGPARPGLGLGSPSARHLGPSLLLSLSPTQFARQ